MDEDGLVASGVVSIVWGSNGMKRNTKEGEGTTHPIGEILHEIDNGLDVFRSEFGVEPKDSRHYHQLRRTPLDELAIKCRASSLVNKPFRKGLLLHGDPRLLVHGEGFIDFNDLSMRMM